MKMRCVMEEFDFARALTEIIGKRDAMSEQIRPMMAEEATKRGQNADYIKTGKLSNITVDDYLRKDPMLAAWWNMLDCLAEGFFKHAFDYWSKLRDRLDKDDIDLYAKVMIEEACHSTETENLFTSSGYFWLLRKLDAGELDTYVDFELEKEIINRGFWQYAGKYFSKAGYPCSYDVDDFELIQKYLTRVDLRTVKDHANLVLWGSLPWPNKSYQDAVKQVEPELSRDEIVVLIRPIIDRAIHEARIDECRHDHMDEIMVRCIRIYDSYLDHPVIQDLLKESIKEVLYDISSSYGWENAKIFKQLINLVLLNDFDLIQLASKSLPDIPNLGVYLVENNLDPCYFNREVQVKVCQMIKDGVAYWEIHDRSAIVPYLACIQQAVKAGWLDREWAIGYVQPKLEKYLGKKRERTAYALNILAVTLESSFVGIELYNIVVNRIREDQSSKHGRKLKQPC